MRTISTVLPDYGEIQIELYEFTEQIYDLLNREKINEIDRLKKLHHLGLISEIYEGTHHYKWEYILIQIYISQILKKNDKTTGLNSSGIKLKSGTKISTIDLMNSWSLILNIGHLQRTFSAERYWFEEILTSKELQKTIINKLSRPIFQNKFKKILKEENYFGFYGIISILYIQEELMQKSIKIATYMLDIMELWFSKRTSKALKNAQNIYKIIRHMSFIYLDTNNSHSLVKINTHLFFKHIENNVLKIVEDLYQSDLFSTFQNLELMLYNNLYSSSKFKTAFMCYLKERRILVKKKIKLRPKDTQRGITSGDKFIKLLLMGRKDDIALRWNKSVYNHEIRFDFRSQFLFEKKTNCKFFTEEKELNNSIKPFEFLIVPIKSYNLNLPIIDVFSTTEYNFKTDNRYILYKMKSYICQHYKYDDFTLIALNNIFQDFFNFAFNSITLKKYKTKFIQDSIDKSHNFDYIVNKSRTSKILNKISLKIENNVNLDADRKHELNSLLKVLKQKKLDGFTLISFKSLIFFNEEKKSLVEFDGISLNFSRNRITIILVEAKNGRTNSNIALKELKEKIKKLGIDKTKIIEENKIGTGCAYIILKL